MARKKGKPVPATAEPTAAPAENPRFENSDGFRRLSAEIERRRAAGLLGEREPSYFSRSPKAIGPISNEALEALKRRHGITDADIERAAAEIAQEPHETLAEQRREAREATWAKICPPLFLEPFDISKVPAETSREAVEEVLAWQFGPRGLFIVGETNRAKTTTMYAMLREKYVTERKSVKIIDGTQFAYDCSLALRDASLTEGWLREMMAPDILAIDDIAKRFTEATQQGFFDVLNRRTTHLKPIIITSNCSGGTLEGMIKDPQLAGPTRRRIKQFFEPVTF